MLLSQPNKTQEKLLHTFFNTCTAIGQRKALLYTLCAKHRIRLQFVAISNKISKSIANVLLCNHIIYLLLIRSTAHIETSLQITNLQKQLSVEFIDQYRHKNVHGHTNKIAKYHFLTTYRWARTRIYLTATRILNCNCKQKQVTEHSDIDIFTNQ